MRTQGGGRVEYPQRFFRLSLHHDSLENMFRVNFVMMQHHKYSLTELENMFPWEREIYTNMLREHIEEENERLRAEKNRHGGI